MLEIGSNAENLYHSFIRYLAVSRLISLDLVFS